MTRTKIKYIAVIAMLLNHIAHIFAEPGTAPAILMTGIGYFTAPVMCCFLVQGFVCTRSRVRYGTRLFIFGLISQLPFRMVFGPDMFNMMFTLLICFLILCLMEHVENRPVCTVLVFVLIILSFWCDWPIVAPILTVMLYVRHTRRQAMCSYVVCAALSAVFTYMNFVEQPGYTVVSTFVLSVICYIMVMLAGYIVIYQYDGQKEEKPALFHKWFFYLFYPTHLLALYLINT